MPSLTRNLSSSEVSEVPKAERREAAAGSSHKQVLRKLSRTRAPHWKLSSEVESICTAKIRSKVDEAIMLEVVLKIEPNVRIRTPVRALTTISLILGADVYPQVIQPGFQSPVAQKTVSRHIAFHEAVKRIPRPEQRPQSGPAAPSERRQCTTSGTHSRAHQEHAQRGHRALSSVTRAASRVISSADPAASRAVQCHPRGHQVPTERHQQRQQQRQPRRTRGHQPHNERHQERATSGPAPSAAFSVHRAASFAPPSATSSAHSSVLSGIRAQRTAPRAATTERHQAGQQPCPPSAHHTDQRCRASVAPREAPTTCSPGVPNRRPQQRQPSANRRSPAAPTAAPSAASASNAQPYERLPPSANDQRRRSPAALTERHQERQPNSAQQAPSAAPTERQSPRPQLRPSAAPTAPDTWSLATLRAPPGAPNDQRRRSRAALTERQRERQPQPHRSATAARQQHLSCARRITPMVAPSAQTRH
ncbi:serine/arginine repetitive matrix protein 1-like [Drosophila suzukii]|uniref:Serine/arginine repetitive matrix protein 1-like n=1 Tax=Drosophila suzukii TaxID=28584 RepID=A0ABM4TW34_DROSZ